MDWGDWTVLEVAKLATAAATPLVVAYVAHGFARAAKRIEQAQWTNQKVIERRLDLLDRMAPLLNDLLCFFRLVGDFKNITPPIAVERKRELDRLYHVYRPLMSQSLVDEYRYFMSACFDTYQGIGQDAKLRASVQRQRTERGDQWDSAWESSFVLSESRVESLTSITRSYRRLLSAFADDLNVPDSFAPEDGAHSAPRNGRAS